MADPHVEIGVNPGARKNLARHGDCSRGSNGFAGSECAKVGIGFDAPVKLSQEFAAVAWVILPSIFTIEKKTNRKWLVAGNLFS